MSVSFNWGNNRQSLPEDASFLLTRMTSAIHDNSNREFVKLVKRAAQTVEEGKTQEYWEEIQKILTSALKEPLKDFLTKEKDGYNRFINVRVKGGGSVENQSNVKFLENLTLKDLLNDDVKVRLIGAGGASKEYGDNFDKLPAFDIEEFLEEQGDSKVMYDVILREKMIEGIPSRIYNISHSKDTSSMDAMIETKIWNYDEGDMLIKKLDYITELTGQSPKFIKSSGKSELDINTIKYSFSVPPSVLNKMKKGFAGDFVTEYTLTKEKNKRVFIEGETTKLTGGTFDMLNPATWMRGFIMTILETKKPRGTAPNGKKVYAVTSKKTTKYFSMQLSNAEGSNIDVEWGSESKGTPTDFITKHAPVFYRALKDKLDDPLTVITVKLQANIKFSETRRPTFGEVASKTNKKEKSDIRFSKLVYVDKKTNDILSDEDYKNLDNKDKANYKPIDKLLTEKEIIDLSNQAFKNRDTGETISEKEWKVLEPEEKNKYVSDIRVFDHVELDAETDRPLGTISYKDMNEFQKDVLGVSAVSAEDIEEKFKNAIADITIILKFHGKYNMNPYREGSNRPMNSHINKGKKVIRAIVKAIKLKPKQAE